MQCEHCGHIATGPGYNQEVCEACGGPQPYMHQPNPTHSEMEMRNMPAPGEKDMGGNPLQEGFMADGGWQNRMKRDESFASVAAAPFNEADEEYEMEVEDPKEVVAAERAEVAERIAAWDHWTSGRNTIYDPWYVEANQNQELFEASPPDESMEASIWRTNVATVRHEGDTKLAFLPLLAPLLAPVAEMGAGAIAGRIGMSAAGHLLGNALEGHDGGGNAAVQQLNQPGAVTQPWETLSGVHAQLVRGEYEHPSSNPGFDDTDDPEDVDQHEHNDGENPPETDEGVGSDGFDVDSPIGQAFQEALPSLLKYYDAPESGRKDPAIAKLVHLVEQEMPGAIGAQPTDEDKAAIQEMLRLHKGDAESATEAPQAVYEDGRGESPGEPSAVGHKALSFVPGIGGLPAAPGTQMLQNPVAQPGGQVAPHTQGQCPQCGARVTPGQGICPQCNAAIDPSPDTATAVNPQAPVGPAGQAVPPVMASLHNFIIDERLAANQGPHNPEQFQAVKQYLEAQGRPELVQDLIDHPENYGDILAEIQNKQQPANPDPDPGPAPMQPDPSQMPQMQGDPSQGQMPMMAAVHGLAPKCPNCDSHTTEVMVSDIDPGNFACHNCGHQWQKDNVIPTKGGKTAFESDDRNPVAAPAADQVRPDDPSRDDNPGGTWATQDGDPLVVGQEYEMYSAKYDVPDVVRIEAVKPDSIEYTLTGEYGLEHRTEVSKQEAQMDGISFLATGEHDQDPEAQMNEQGPNDQMNTPNMAPALSAVKTSELWSPQHGRYQAELGPEGIPIVNWPQQEGLQPSGTEETPVMYDPHMQFPGAQERGVVHRGWPGAYHQYMRDAMEAEHPEHAGMRTFPQGTPRGDDNVYPHMLGTTSEQGANWYAEPGTDPALLDRLNRNLGLQAHNPYDYAEDEWDDGPTVASTMHTAGAKFTPMEQRAFVDEQGKARNSDKLDLTGTHYEAREQAGLSDDFFLFGL